MLSYRYEIQVNDTEVEIHGELTSQEAIHLINFFSGIGYSTLSHEYDSGASIYLLNKDLSKKMQEEIDEKAQLLNEDKIFELNEKIKHLSAENSKLENKLLGYSMMEKENGFSLENYKNLEKQKEKLEKELRLAKLEMNEDAKKIIANETKNE